MAEATSVEMSSTQRGILVRLLRFGAGLAVGAMLFFGLLLGGSLGWSDLHMADVTLNTSGADISAHHGTRLAIRRETGVIVQSCNGGCDDLSIVNQGRSNGFEDIRVLDGRGGCVACVVPPGLALGQRREDLTIAGAPRLVIAQTSNRTGRHD